MAFGDIEAKLDSFNSLKVQILYKVYSLPVGAAFQPRLKTDLYKYNCKQKYVKNKNTTRNPL